MIDEFIKKWDVRKDILREAIENSKIDDLDKYEDLVKLVVTHIINDEKSSRYLNKNKFDLDSIVTIDDGDYQGSQLFIMHEDIYQPSVDDYYYTSVCYGSCSGCDTLLGIINFSNYDELPNEKQVKDFMTLCLHLLQNFKKMGE